MDRPDAIDYIVDPQTGLTSIVVNGVEVGIIPSDELTFLIRDGDAAHTMPTGLSTMAHDHRVILPFKSRENAIDCLRLLIRQVERSGGETGVCDHVYDRDCICMRCGATVDHTGPWQNSPNEGDDA